MKRKTISEIEAEVIILSELISWATLMTREDEDFYLYIHETRILSKEFLEEDPVHHTKDFYPSKKDVRVMVKQAHKISRALIRRQKALIKRYNKLKSK
jgi:hypothetical protein